MARELAIVVQSLPKPTRCKTLAITLFLQKRKMQNKRKLIFGLIPFLLMAFLLGGCEKMKARKCGECPDFKNKRKKPKKRRSMINMPIQQLELDQSVAVIRV